MKTYVCAFRGRRDDYQVPLALAQEEMLDQFITDFYAGRMMQSTAKLLPRSWSEKVLFRCKKGLHARCVRSLLMATLIERVRHATRQSKAVTFAKIDRLYSMAASVRARRTRANLLLYSPYAWEAFTSPYAHQPRRVLFQYHPHAPYEARLLQRDVKRYPQVALSYAQETGEQLSAVDRQRVDDCWQHADRILCASSFTRQTLLEAGAVPERCVVAPYGIEIPNDNVEMGYGSEQPSEGFHALFVGSGVQRKGLHHLLLAWKQARLPVESSLTLICRSIDPGLRELVASSPRVRHFTGVNAFELASFYQRSTLFVMPSLIEGFGQVYLEALAHGCPVLGTTNTCLPDLGTEADGIFLTEVADVDQLAHRLETLSSLLLERGEMRVKARACAQRFPWAAFRSSVVAQL